MDYQNNLMGQLGVKGECNDPPQMAQEETALMAIDNRLRMILNDVRNEVTALMAIRNNAYGVSPETTPDVAGQSNQPDGVVYQIKDVIDQVSSDLHTLSCIRRDLENLV